MNNQQRKREVQKRLQAALKPTALEIIDESHKHAGHAGSREGKAHFDVRITSPLFEGKNTLQRHRMVYDALGELMQDHIHALAIQARAPGEP